VSNRGYLLDTNVVSETRRREPHPGVLAFLASVSSSLLFLSVITVGELRRGVAARRRTDPTIAAALREWVDELAARFADQLLPVDVAVADRWGELTSPGAVPVVDALIAATALEHDLTVVTRNVKDFERFEVDLLDPWASASDDPRQPM
jgi:predicted nucleic acid-binding protein